MSGFFTRIFKLFQAEADAALSRLEDPVKLSERGVRDLKSNLSDAIISLAQVKSVAIRMRKEAEDETHRARAHEHKAVAILGRAKAGQLAAAEADRLASEMLRLKGVAEARSRTLEANAEQQEQHAAKLQSRAEHLKREVNRYEGELTTLRARATTARSARRINQHLAKADSSSTASMLGRMRDKVAHEEAVAEAYEQLGDIADNTVDIERKVDAVLSNHPPVADSLAELKARLGLSNGYVLEAAERD